MPQATHADDLKLTKNQSLVLAVLQSSEQPLSAYSILDRLREHGLKAPLQIYRALDKLLDAGRVHRLESMNAFVVCCHPGTDKSIRGSRLSRYARPAARSTNSTTRRSRMR
ncbi:Zinc uptake regulation protein [Ensifer psoraleae]|nr:Zinc uptake regulation protein [Sinorhizobium psoraleae]